MNILNSDVVYQILSYLDPDDIIIIIELFNDNQFIECDYIFKLLLQNQVTDMKLIDFGIRINMYKLWKELYGFGIFTSNYHQIPLVKIYEIFLRAISINSIELLIFALSRRCIPTSKYKLYLKKLIKSNNVRLFNILVTCIDNSNSYKIEMLLECWDKMTLESIRTSEIIDDDDGTVIRYLMVNNISKLNLSSYQIRFKFDLDLLGKIDNTELFSYYVNGFSTLSKFSCDNLILKLKDEFKLRVLIESQSIVIKQMERIILHLLNLKYFHLVEYLVINRTKTISRLLLNKIKVRSCINISQLIIDSDKLNISTITN